jgi:hypothetical protein
MTERPVRRRARHPPARSLRRRRFRPLGGGPWAAALRPQAGSPLAEPGRERGAGRDPSGEGSAASVRGTERARAVREGASPGCLESRVWEVTGVWMYPHKEVSAALRALRAAAWSSLESSRHQRSEAGHLLIKRSDVGAGRKPDGRTPRVLPVVEAAQLPAPSRKGPRRGGQSTSRVAKRSV